MNDRRKLISEYWLTLDRILDLHGITGDRSFAKKSLHKRLKKAGKVVTLTRLTSPQLRSFIDDINEFFPLHHNQ